MDISTLIYSECQQPIKVSIYNGITNKYEYKQVPCGKCYHCKITRINEWVTRMVLQSNYSKYVYFGTLTYSSQKATTYTYECLAIKSNFNRYNRWIDSPMILRKDHVQKFFKRLRKNTKIKLQYAYCGEYGSTYSRPHYHYIIWCNEPISQSDIYKAWRAPSVDDPKKTNIIGRVDHVDIKNNPRKVTQKGDVEAVYKYVCKYIQKYDFKFNELKNYQQHEKAYHYYFEKSTLLSIQHDEYIKKYEVKDFFDYQKMASPFFHCSKKPAIGYQYLADHIDKFQNGDFRLFGIRGKNYLFPLYFIRKTKESLCPIKAQSETNESTTSYSRIPRMAAVLENIKTAIKFEEDFEQAVKLYEYKNHIGTIETRRDCEFHDLERVETLYDKCDTQAIRSVHYRFNRDYLGFTNHETKVKYIFCGDNYEMYCTTTKELLGTESIENVIYQILYYYEILKTKILRPLYGKSQISAYKKESLINDCGGIDKFNEKKALCVDMLNRQIESKQAKYKLTKTLE